MHPAASLTGIVRAQILIFSAYLLHAPLANRLDRIRLTSDTRYFPRDGPVDERHMALEGSEDGHTRVFERLHGQRTMAQACQEWGLVFR